MLDIRNLLITLVIITDSYCIACREHFHMLRELGVALIIVFLSVFLLSICWWCHSDYSIVCFVNESVDNFVRGLSLHRLSGCGILVIWSTE
jgi:hypothetical protein